MSQTFISEMIINVIKSRLFIVNITHLRKYPKDYARYLLRFIYHKCVYLSLAKLLKLMNFYVPFSKLVLVFYKMIFAIIQLYLSLQVEEEKIEKEREEECIKTL